MSNAYGIYLTGSYTGSITIKDIPYIIASEGDVSGTAYGIYVNSSNILSITDIDSYIQGAAGECNNCRGIHVNGTIATGSITDIPIIRGSYGNASGTVAGIYLNGVWNDLVIKDNARVEGVSENHSAVTMYGLRLSSVTVSGDISGNLIRGGDMLGTNGNAYGIYFDGSQFDTQVKTNTINAADEVSPGGNTYGIYINNSDGGLNIDSNTSIRGALSGGGANGSPNSANDNCAIYMTGTSAPSIINNSSIIGSTNSSGTGIIMYNLSNYAAKEIIIDSNLIEGSAISNDNSYGIQHLINSQDLTKAPRITNNIIKANDGTGVGCIAFLLYTNNTRYMDDIISNNVLYGGKGGSTAGPSGDASAGIVCYSTSTTDRIRISVLNNIIYNDVAGTHSYGIAEYTLYSDPDRIHNNMVFNSTYYYYDENSNSRAMGDLNASANTCSCTPSGNIENTKSIADTFTDEANNDFSTKAGADSIDSGMDATDLADGKVRKDFAGTDRPQGGDFDIGPYEM